MDPLAEKAPNWNPYRYSFNNKIKMIDADGLLEINDEATLTQTLSDVGLAYAGSKAKSAVSQQNIKAKQTELDLSLNN